MQARVVGAIYNSIRCRVLFSLLPSSVACKSQVLFLPARLPILPFIHCADHPLALHTELQLEKEGEHLESMLLHVICIDGDNRLL